MVNVTAAVGREQPFEIEEFELEERRAGEVLVRVVAAGTYHTDPVVWDQWYGVPLPVVLGHEGAGILERAGEGIKDRFPFDHLVRSYSLEEVDRAAEDREKDPALRPLLRIEQA
jgi:aryl-alcohol dehydrogenase